MVKVLNNTNIVGQSTSLVFKTNINDSIGKWTITLKEPLELYDGITLKVMVTTVPDLNRNTLQFKYGYETTPETIVYKSPSTPITSIHIDKYAILSLTYTTIDGNRGWYADAESKIEFPTQPNDFGKVGVKNGSIVKYIEATEEHDTIGLTAGDNITLEVNEETRDITIISTAVTEVGNLNTLSTESLTPSSGENFSNNIALHRISKTGNYNDLNNKPTIPTVPTEISAFNNDVGYITLNDVPQQVNADWNSDSGVSEILNKPTIHTYTAGEGIEISQNDVISCTVEQDTDHAHLEHLDYASSGHTGFQPTLSSQNAGTDISITVVNGIPKINNTQIPVQPSWGSITGTLSNQTDLQNALDAKQNELTAGEGITIDDSVISVTDIEKMTYKGSLDTLIIPEGSINGDVYKIESDTFGQKLVYDYYPSGTWRTFTSAEIKYLVHQRDNEGTLKCFCIIDDQYKGFMMFPDDFVNETQISINWNAETSGNHYSDNEFTIQEFKQLESEGAVLFPCTVFINRNTNRWSEIRCKSVHLYWTGTKYGNKIGTTFTWWDDYGNDPTLDTIGSSDFLRCDDNWQMLNPFAVRLIQVVDETEKSFKITLSGNTYYIKFAPGNLWYNCQSHKFKFAENQYDACTLQQDGYSEWVANPYITLTDNRWIDTMAYGSSGYNQQWTPAVRSVNDNLAPNSNITNTNYDWGKYNAIGEYIDAVWPAGSSFVRYGEGMIPLSFNFIKDDYEQISNIKNKQDTLVPGSGISLSGTNINTQNIIWRTW